MYAIRSYYATGPYEGEIRRPSDKKHPKKIAWIQCVGSRQVIEGGKQAEAQDTHIQRPPLIQGCQDANRNAEQRGYQHRRQTELQGCRSMTKDELQDRLPGGSGDAQVAVGQPVKVVQILV